MNDFVSNVCMFNIFYAGNIERNTHVNEGCIHCEYISIYIECEWLCYILITIELRA